jgi:hypothetical protein
LPHVAKAYLFLVHFFLYAVDLYLYLARRLYRRFYDLCSNFCFICSLFCYYRRGFGDFLPFLGVLHIFFLLLLFYCLEFTVVPSRREALVNSHFTPRR